MVNFIFEDEIEVAMGQRLQQLYGCPAADGTDGDSRQRAFLEHSVATHNAPCSRIRNCPLGLTAVIKQEGKI